MDTLVQQQHDEYSGSSDTETVSINSNTNCVQVLDYAHEYPPACSDESSDESSEEVSECSDNCSEECNEESSEDSDDNDEVSTATYLYQNVREAIEDSRISGRQICMSNFGYLVVGLGVGIALAPLVASSIDEWAF